MNLRIVILICSLLTAVTSYADELNCLQAIHNIYGHSAQSNSLKESLHRMGVVVQESEDSYISLRKLSDKNRRKYMTSLDEIPDEIKETVESLRIIFVHNRSPRINSQPIEGDALLSARKLGRGAQNTYNYNREFLQSDDNIFFFVKFIGKDFNASEARGFGISYGNISFHLDKEYAQNYGWISPFNMYPRELATFLGGRNKFSEAQESLKALRDSGTMATPEELSNIPKTVLNELSHGTFTPSDFEKLVKNNLKNVLAKMKTINPSEYENIIGLLQEGNPNEIDLIIRNHVFMPLKLASRHKRYEMFEFKVPSHVPKEYITIYE